MLRFMFLFQQRAIIVCSISLLIADTALLQGCIMYAVEKPEFFVKTGRSDTLSAAAFSPDGRYALGGSSDKTMKLWDMAAGSSKVWKPEGDSYTVASIVFSPDGLYAVTGSSDGYRVGRHKWNNEDMGYGYRE